MQFFFNVGQVKAANQAAGQCWFSPSTMRFFKSRVLSTVYGGRSFVTSEQGPNGVRAYSVRETTEDGSSISTVGEFQGWATAPQAKRGARRLGSLVPAYGNGGGLRPSPLSLCTFASGAIRWLPSLCLTILCGALRSAASDHDESITQTATRICRGQAGGDPERRRWPGVT